MVNTRKEKTQERIETLLRLIEQNPDCITISVVKLMRLANLKQKDYMSYRNTWAGMKDTTKFKLLAP